MFTSVLNFHGQCILYDIAFTLHLNFGPHISNAHCTEDCKVL